MRPLVASTGTGIIQLRSHSVVSLKLVTAWLVLILVGS